MNRIERTKGSLMAEVARLRARQRIDAGGDVRLAGRSAVPESLATAAIEQVAAGIVACDRDGIVILANAAARALGQIDPLLHPFREVFPLRYETAQDQEHDRGSVPFHAISPDSELVLPSERGQPVHLRAIVAPIKVGEMLGYVVTLRDVTERRVAREDALAEQD